MTGCVVTTSWDDGHKLDFRLAELLKKYGLRGTFYVAPENCEWDNKDLLSNDQIKQISRDFEIGAHTITHSLLTKVDENEAFQEVKDSKIFLEELIGEKVKMFCYPRGLYSEKVKTIVSRVGFLGARTIRRFSVSYPFDPFEFGTTVHAFGHRLNFDLGLPLSLNFAFFPSLLTKDWLKIARRMFDYVNKNGGLYHLWGHSWEIDKYDDWDKLEEFFSYVGGRENIRYLTNYQVVAGFNDETEK